MPDLDPAVVRLLDEDAPVRREAAEAVDTSALPARFALRQALLTDEDAEVRALAAQRLGNARDRRFVPAMLEALRDPMPSVRDRAWRALARLGAEAVVPHAARAVREEPVWWVRRAAVRAAASVAGREALEVLLGALEDPFWRVRHAAVQALEWLGAGDATLRQQVRDMAEQQPREPLRSAVAYLSSVWEAQAEHSSPLPPGEGRGEGSRSRGLDARGMPPLPLGEGWGEGRRAEDASPGNEDPAVVTARLEATPAASVSARELVEWLGDPHEPLRLLARRRLRERRDLEALRLAMRWLDEPRVPHAADEARALLERLEVEDVVLAARVLEDAPRPGAVAWASGVAVRRADGALLEQVRALARHHEPTVRRAALSGLVFDPESRDLVLAALGDSEEVVREEVIAAWERRPPAPSAADAFARALVAFAPRARTTRERRAVAMAAAFLEDSELLTRAARDSEVSVLAVALGALSELGLLSEAERLESLRDEDPWIRAVVLDVESARAACLEDADPSVRRAALDLLIAWNRGPDVPHPSPLPGGEGALSAVGLGCSLALDPWVRARCSELLEPARSLDELGALLRLSLDTAPMVRAAAASVLEACDSLDSHLEALLHGPSSAEDSDVRASAWTWLLRHADGPAFDRLRTALREDSEPARVTAHLEALTLVFPDDLVASAPDVARRQPTRPPRGAPAPATERTSASPHATWRPLGTTGLHVSPLVLSGAHLSTTEPFFEARDAGVNTFFWEPHYAALTQFLRNARNTRERLVIVGGTYHAGASALRRDVESALRRLRTSWLDVFLLFWVRSPERLSSEDFAALERLRAEGKVRAFGFSTHLRDLARDALTRHPWPVVMTRHSAAHPGAEARFLPEAHAHGTGVLTFTATCYGRLLRPDPGAPTDTPLPTAVDCYRYSLSQPGVSAALTAPRSRRELRHNLDVLARPWMEPDALPVMRAHGERVRAQGRQLDALVRRAPGGPRDALLALMEEDGP